MATLNKVFLIGNLTRDPELKYTANGTAIAKFGLAVNRVYNSPDGEKKEDTCFVDVTAYGKLAEICAEHLTKGRLVLIEGRLQYQSWKDEDGAKRSKIEVVAQNVQFLGSKQEGDETEENTSDSDIPF
jgi:single-strand DNA-binding protein